MRVMATFTRVSSSLVQPSTSDKNKLSLDVEAISFNSDNLISTMFLGLITGPAVNTDVGEACGIVRKCGCRGVEAALGTGIA